MIYFQENTFSPVTECSQEKFNEVIGSRKVAEGCAKIAEHAMGIRALLPETAETKQEIKELKGKIQTVKKRLPAFIFQGAFPGGRRKQQECRLTGLYMVDFDHIGNPKDWVASQLTGTPMQAELLARLQAAEITEEEYYDELCKGFFEQLNQSRGVLLAHITPSGEGLRIVAKADANAGNLADNQAHLAKALGLTNDEAVKDASRISFAFPKENLLYLNNELFTYNNDEYDRKFGDNYRRGNSAGSSQSGSRDSVPARRCDVPGDDTLKYRGVPYSEIIKEWWRQHGEPVEGERNVKLHKLAYCLRYITDRNEELLQKVMPDFGLDAGEMRSLIGSACDARMYTNIPDELQKVLKAVGAVDKTKSSKTEMSDGEAQKQIAKAERIALEAQTMDDFLRRFNALKLPVALQAICAGVPENVKIGAVLAALPMIYTHLTRVSFEHFDGVPSRLSGMTFVIGAAASGKSFIIELDRLLMAPIRAMDKLQRKKEDEYRDARERAKNDKGKDQPEKKTFCIRIIPIQVSNSKLAQRMRDAHNPEDPQEKWHVYSIESELATAIRAAKSGTWIEKNDIYCKAFHNELWGMDYANDQAINGEIQVNYNLVVSGTQDSFNKLIPNNSVLSGLPTRLMFFPMPATRFRMIDKNRGRRSPEEQSAINQLAAALAGNKLGEIDATPITDAMYDWCADIAKDAEMADDEELDDLRKRTALIGVRAGIAYAVLQQSFDDISKSRTPEFDDDAIEFARFIADFCLYTQYVEFARRMREQKQRVEEYTGERERPLRLKDVYNRLPAEFTLDDLEKLRPDVKRDTLRMNCQKWIEKRFLQKKVNYEKTYKKIITRII